MVLVLQAAVVVTFLLDPTDPPKRGALWQGLWALDRKPTFVPLVALLAVGPAATWLAWSIRGPHRRRLVIGWTLFGCIAATWFAHRIWVMTTLMWEHGV